MFGYVKPFKPNLRICEYDTYRAVYCGLCKVLGREYGFAARMTLSYDFAFLGLFEFALNDKEFKTVNQRCLAHPLKKTPCLTSLEGLDFTAAAAVILTYHKLKDDISDKGFMKRNAARLIICGLKRGYKKAAKKLPELAGYITERLNEQTALEKEKCKSIDRASEPTAKILGEIMTYLSDDAERKNTLNRIGYLLGRYIYIADAFDDVFDDFKKSGFNPLIIGNPVINSLEYDEVQKRTETSVNFTLGALADAYVGLEFERFKPVLDNIIYLGLKRGFYELSEKRKTKLEEDNA